jgi:hypothetical protein
MNKAAAPSKVLTKRFVVDSISRETFVDGDLLTEEQALRITDEQMASVADAIGDRCFDGDVFGEVLSELADELKS